MTVTPQRLASIRQHCSRTDVPQQRIAQRHRRAYYHGCFLTYSADQDRWVMRSQGNSCHTIDGDSSPERINAHWSCFKTFHSE